MKLLIFLEGTVLKHSSDDKIKDYASYEPISGAVKKLVAWVESGAEISYLTSRVKFAEIKQIQDVLKKFEFPGTVVHARKEGESYVEVVEAIKPDVLVEDDCASKAEEDDEVILSKLNPELNVYGIVVPEFGGIDHLPDELDLLKEFGKKENIVADEDI